MKKISQITGMPVIDAKGNLTGEVERVVYSNKRGRVIGIILKKGRIIKDQTAVRFKDIVSIGQDVIIVKDGSRQVNPHSIVEISNAMEEQDIMGYPVITSDGREVGIIKDVVINENNGIIEGYIIAGDLFEDLMEGRKVLKSGDDIIIGNGSVIVNTQSQPVNLQKSGGLKSLFKLEE